MQDLSIELSIEQSTQKPHDYMSKLEIIERREVERRWKKEINLGSSAIFRLVSHHNSNGNDKYAKKWYTRRSIAVLLI